MMRWRSSGRGRPGGWTEGLVALERSRVELGHCQLGRTRGGKGEAKEHGGIQHLDTYAVVAIVPPSLWPASRLEQGLDLPQQFLLPVWAVAVDHRTQLRA